MDIENEQRPAATGRCNGIAFDHVQEQSYQSGPMVEVRVGNLSDALQDEPLFVVDPIIPRDEVTLLSGHGDIGKSYLALAIAVHVACGQDWGPFPVKAGRVLVVTLEDIARRVRYRLARIVSAYQMDAALLDRKPRHFYDLVIEVAIVRPGPIQGDMVHPYLARRNGKEPVTYPSEDVRKVLERTLGIPLFQEQVMQLAIVAAGYSGGEADQLRRSMAAWKRHGDIEKHRERITQGMLARGYSEEFSVELFDRLKGFGSYGFPESHAASFALLAYASAWLKCHEPAAFVCALLNSLPMGFYSESQLVQDARRHGIEVRSVDVRSSGWDCTLEDKLGDASRQPAVRLGFRLIRGFRENVAERIHVACARCAFADTADLVERAGLDARDRQLLADAGALPTRAHRSLHAQAENRVEESRSRQEILTAPAFTVTVPTPLHHPGRHAPESVAGIDRNGWPASAEYTAGGQRSPSTLRAPSRKRRLKARRVPS